MHVNTEVKCLSHLVWNSLRAKLNFPIIFLSLILNKLTDEEEIRFSETDNENDVDNLSSADTGSSSDSMKFDSEAEKMRRNTRVRNKLKWKSPNSSENRKKLAKCSNNWGENAVQTTALWSIAESVSDVISRISGLVFYFNEADSSKGESDNST